MIRIRSDPTVTNCTFTENTAGSGGGRRLGNSHKTSLGMTSSSRAFARAEVRASGGRETNEARSYVSRSRVSMSSGAW